MPASLRLSSALLHAFINRGRCNTSLSRSCNFATKAKVISPARTPSTPRNPRRTPRARSVVSHEGVNTDDYPSALQELVYRIDQHLKAGNDDEAVKCFHTTLSRGKLDGPTRFRAYDATIALLIRRARTLQAGMIYSSLLQDGFLPSVTIRAQMRIISKALKGPSEPHLLETMKIDFCHPSYDEACLRDLIHLLQTNLDSEPDFIDQAVDAFLETRPAGYTLSEDTISLLVHIHARARSSRTAREWISKHTRPSQDNSDSSSGGQAYTTLLRDLATTDAEASMTYRWILQNMAAENVVPDLAFYNALIAAEVTRHRFDRAFAIYRLLLEHRTEGIMPDAHTYASLFRALRHIKRPRSARTRRHRAPRTAPTARALYREMFACHVLATDGHPARASAVVDAGVLHGALRAFLRARDYAAAFVALRTLRVCGLRATLRTVRTVLAGVLARVAGELPRLSRARDPARAWTFRFLGLAGFPPGKSVDIDAELLALVLRLGSQRRLSLRYVPEGPPPPGKQYSMPTVEQLMGTEVVSADVEWDTTPLERMLRRAILADRLHTVFAPAKEVSVEIAQAKAELFKAQLVETKSA